VPSDVLGNLACGPERPATRLFGRGRRCLRLGPAIPDGLGARADAWARFTFGVRLLISFCPCSLRRASGCADADPQGPVGELDWSVRRSRDPESSALVQDGEAAREAPPASAACWVVKPSPGFLGT